MYSLVPEMICRRADHAAAVVGSGRLTGDGAQFAFVVLLSSAVSRI
jgi:hypothetical protein